jgi:hypothetical protein
MGNLANYQTLDSRYDEFLFAELGQQANGMPMSMASGLTRLELDPWEEASRLAALPASTAVTAVTALIGRIPDLTSITSEVPKLAAGLVPLLARGNIRPVKAAPVRALPWWQTVLQSDRRWLFAAIAIGILVAISQLFLAH